MTQVPGERLARKETKAPEETKGRQGTEGTRETLEHSVHKVTSVRPDPKDQLYAGACTKKLFDLIFQFQGSPGLYGTGGEDGPQGPSGLQGPLVRRGS